MTLVSLSTICILAPQSFGRVSTHEATNKMSTANLALVFGPTLTLAPSDIDPRRLHNDVPAVNVLIQTCLEHHDFLFQFERAKSPEERPSDKKSKSPDEFTMSQRESSPHIASTHEPLPLTRSPVQSSPMVCTPTTPPATDQKHEAEPTLKQEKQGGGGDKTEDKKKGQEEEEEEEEDEDTDLDTEEGESNLCVFGDRSGWCM